MFWWSHVGNAFLTDLFCLELFGIGWFWGFSPFWLLSFTTSCLITSRNEREFQWFTKQDYWLIVRRSFLIKIKAQRYSKLRLLLHLLHVSSKISISLVFLRNFGVMNPPWNYAAKRGREVWIKILCCNLVMSGLVRGCPNIVENLRFSLYLKFCHILGQIYL